ncbi:unnamed protein product [Caenorhabditis bovis]|uniref:Uncharacterized protein n=1 Tax=Caenorhabditis bovis TaxID=2654633 RepID=A0A8S1ESV2_9PELO|nr:unnamed protein product [Caenorhabditis bovis]
MQNCLIWRDASQNAIVAFQKKIPTPICRGGDLPMETQKQVSAYLIEKYEEALSQNLKGEKSQYVLETLNKKPLEKNAELKGVDSEYILRSLQKQAEENPNISRDAPHRPLLVAAPVSAKELRTQIESLDNAVVVPQIVNGKVYFTTHGEADTKTAVEGSTSNPNLQASGGQLKEGVDLSKVKFTFAQLVQLLGPATCERLEREFAKQNKLSEAEIAQLKTARESASSTNLLTAQSPEPNLLSTRTANSVEPNLLTVHSAKSPGLATQIFQAQSPGINTAQPLEPNLLSTHTANSLEPNLLTVHSAKSPGLATQIFQAQSPGIQTAQTPEPNLLSTKTAASASTSSVSGKPSTDVSTCIEFTAPTSDVETALGASQMSSKDVNTAVELLSSQDVQTAKEILSSIKSSQDVKTAIEIARSGSSQNVYTATDFEAKRSSKDVATAIEIGSTTDSQTSTANLGPSLYKDDDGLKMTI